MSKTKTTLSGLSERYGKLPLSALVPSSHNMRKQERSQASIQEMASLIRSAGGIIQNLVVHPIKNGRKLSGSYGVAAGETRRLALVLLAAEDEASWGSYDVPVLFVSEAEALLMSAQENTRTPVHPADQFEAFSNMVAAKMTAEDVAAAFGVTPDVVRRRLKLAQVAPVFIDMLRNDEISLDVLMALTSVDGHKAQVDLWESLPTYNRNPHTIRSLARNEGVSSTSRFARFVGVDAYQGAGGEVDRDLFDGVVTLRDRALLFQLVQKKLSEQAALIDGDIEVNWVEVQCEAYPHELRSLYTSAPLVKRAPSPAEQAQLEAIQGRLVEIELALSADSGDMPEDEVIALEQEAGEKESEDDALRQSLMNLHPDATTLVGAVVSIDHQGDLFVMRRVIRSEDAARFSAANLSNADESGKKTTKSIHSERLCRQLSAHRSLAIAGNLVSQPRVALAAVTAVLAEQLFHRYESQSHIRLCLINEMYGHLSDERGDTPAAKQYSEAFERWKTRLDDVDGPLLSWMLTQDQDTVISLLALCVASSINGIQASDQDVPAAVPALLSALAVDMSDWWKPTASGYFGLVTKQRTTAVLLEAGVATEDEAQALGSLKKAEIVIEAERLMASSRWVPELMRT